MVNANWSEVDLEIAAQRLYSGGFGRSRKERQRAGAASVVGLYFVTRNTAAR